MSLVSDIAQGYQNVGTAKAQGQANSAAIWGQTLGTLGQIASHVPQQLKEHQIQDVLKKSSGDFEKALPEINAIDPLLGASISQKLFEAKKTAYEFQNAQWEHKSKELEFTLKLAASAKDPESYAQALYTAKLAGMDVSAFPPEYNPHVIEGFNRALMTAKDRAELDKPKPPKDPKLAQITTVNADGQPVTKFVEETAGAEYPQAPPKPGTQPNVGSFEDYVLRTYGKTPTSAQILAARKAYQQADDRPRVDVRVNAAPTSDVKETVAGMKDGSLPPQMPGRASKEYTAIMAEAHRQGYDLAGAVTDWAATQKHIASMNGSQQLRLNQAINQLPDLLDSVDALAAKWKGGRFPVLNRANLALAKNGVFGADVASVANQLAAQIADVTADLGNVYMGGNSPTDHALGLAAKSLSADWDLKVLRDMTALARKNVQIRKNSINSTGVAGASADNPYVPPAAGAAPTEGATKPIPGYPGTEQTFKAGKWIRTK